MSTNFRGIPGISCDESMNFLGFPRIFLTTLWFCSVRSTDFLGIPRISSDKSMNSLGIPRISSDSEREGCWNSQEFFEDRRREGIQVNCSRTWASWFLSFSLALGPLPFSCLSSVLSLSWLGRVCPGGLFKRPPSGLVSQSVSHLLMQLDVSNTFGSMDRCQACNLIARAGRSRKACHDMNAPGSTIIFHNHCDL